MPHLLQLKGSPASVVLTQAISYISGVIDSLSQHRGAHLIEIDCVSLHESRVEVFDFPLQLQDPRR